MGSERVRGRVQERVAALADARLDADDACRAAIAELRRAVGFTRWCWPLTDPDTAIAMRGTGELDFWPSLPRLVELEEHGDVTSKPQLATSARASISLSAATRGDLARSIRWRECLRPYGIGDELMTVCRDRYGCWGSVELMRDDDDPPFSADDVHFLDSLAPTLGALVRGALRRSWQAPPRDGRPLPAATLIVDHELRPTAWTRTLAGWLGELGAEPDGGMLPPAFYEIGSRARTAGAAGLPASVRIHTATGRWATVEGALLDGTSPGQVAITVRAASTAEVFDLLCKTHAFTRRERQLAAFVVEGLATKQLAAACCISPHTVQDHLKALFAKTGLNTRGELTSYLTGQNAGVADGRRRYETVGGPG